MEVAGYRLRERKKKGPERLLPLFWYQLPDDVLRELWRYTGRQRHRYGLRSGSGSGSWLWLRLPCPRVVAVVLGYSQRCNSCR